MNADLLHLLASWAWRTSLEALPLALIAILFWRLRGLPPAWRWWLPALFFLRLAMPQVPETNWQRWGLAAWTPAAVPSLNTIATGEMAAPITTPSAFQILPVLWALGCVAVAGWMLISHWRLRRSVRLWAGPADPVLEQHAVWAAARLGLSHCVPLRVMPGWSTMAVHGWLRPELLIPDDLAERFNVAQIRGMLLHEMAHVRRRDVLWTWLALGLCALHWFNPLAWLALRRFHADRELACDAAALRALDPAARHDYGEALLLCLQGPAFHIGPALAPFFRRFPELKQRLQNIMKPTSPTLRSRLFTALLVPTLAAVTFTTARAQREGDAPKPAPESAPAEKPLRNGDKPRGEREGGREKTRDGEAGKAGPRDGEKPREGARDGEGKRGAERDGDGARMRKGAREGEGESKAGSRDGEQPRKGPRDGEQSKSGTRDGEAKKLGARDGEQPRKGARDGEGERKTGPRDGEGVKAGAREGDAAKTAREGEKPADR